MAAKQEVEAIEQLLADDPLALDIIGGWRAEMTGPEIQEALGLTKTAIRDDGETATPKDQDPKFSL